MSSVALWIFTLVSDHGDSKELFALTADHFEPAGPVDGADAVSLRLTEKLKAAAVRQMMRNLM